MTGVRMDEVAREYAPALKVVSPSGSPSPVRAFGSLGHSVLSTSTLFNTSKMQFKHPTTPSSSTGRLNKFVRRLHDMLVSERNYGDGVVEWRRGLLILHSIDGFTNNVLPKYFNTRNFKTFRRQLNYYGFVHLRSFMATESKTTALWVNQELADHGSDAISSVLMLKRVEPNEATRTPKERRDRKNEAASSVEAAGIIRQSFCFAPTEMSASSSSWKKGSTTKASPPLPKFVDCTRGPPPLLLSVESSNSDESTSEQYVMDENWLASDHVDHTSTTDYTAASMLLCLSRAAT
eukprot:CCRYP_009027-RA/>CCRYP_009027-RA protein AED:0.03 eAED:0.03 QI:424/1/1/1/1/1/2/325/291